MILLFSIAALLAVLAALGVCVLAWASARDVRVGLLLILSDYVIESLLLHPPGLGVGINLLLPDVIFLLVAFAAGVNLFHRKSSDALFGLWIVLGIVLFFSFFYGLIQYKTIAGVEFRQYFYMWSGVLYFMGFTLNNERLHFIAKAFQVVVLALIAIVFYRWTAGAFGFGNQNWLEESANSRFRVIPAHQTYVLFQVFFVGFCYLIFQKIKNNIRPIGLALLGFCIVALQHRTVWVVALISFASLAILDRNFRSKLSDHASWLVIFVLVLIILLVLFSGLAETLYYSTMVEPFSQRSTFTWRVQSWQSFVFEWFKAGPFTWALGFPFGTGFSHYVEAQHAEVDVYPHSYYVTTLLRSGLIGLTSLICLYFLAISRAWKMRSESTTGIPLNLLIILLIGQLVFFVSYSPNFIESVVLGVTLSVLSTASIPVSKAIPAAPFRGLA